MGVMAFVNQSRSSLVFALLASLTFGAFGALASSCTPMASQRVSLRMAGDAVARLLSNWVAFI